MEIIDLKEGTSYLKQYVELRNRYADLLLTSEVNVPQTKDWLKESEGIEIRGLVVDNVLVGVIILYLNKEGEVAFFVRETNKGIGSKLLNIAQDLAQKKNSPSIWAWVLNDNTIAQRVFEKSGFLKKGISERKYKDSIQQGIEYIKYLSC